MTPSQRFHGVMIMAMSSLFGLACARPAEARGELPKPAADLPAPKADEHERVAYLAGGCFWCVEGVFDSLAGVKEAVSGYAGGPRETANYRAVCTGQTGHAEVVKVVYDPHKVTYGQLLRVFFGTHDPTTKDRQGPDVGTQYRSAIFYQTEDEKKVAEAYINQLNDNKTFDRPVVTTVEPLGKGFFEAEEYHQNYVTRNPDQPYIVQQALPKLDKLKKNFAGEMKQEQKK